MSCHVLYRNPGRSHKQMLLLLLGQPPASMAAMAAQPPLYALGFSTAGTCSLDLPLRISMCSNLSESPTCMEDTIEHSMAQHTSSCGYQ